MAEDIGIVSNTTTTTHLLIPDKGQQQPHRSNNDDADVNVMLLVRYLHGATLDCSVISTQNNSFKVVLELDDGNLSHLSLLKEDEFDPRSRPPRNEVCATCNSWLLYRSITSDIPFDSLWNPTTGENASLPFFPFGSERLSVPWAYGIGYDSAGDTYKVLRCRLMHNLTSDYESDYYEMGELSVELLSLSAASDSSREISCPHDPVGIHPLLQPSLYMNGFYYWPTFEGSFVFFDFVKEEFGPLIPKPESDELKTHRGTVYPVEYNASLAAVVFEVRNLRTDIDPTAPFVFEIWVWGKASATWSLVLKREIRASDDAYVVKVLGLYKNHKLFLSDSYGDLLVYDIESRGLVNLGIRDEFVGIMEVFPFVANTESSFKSSSRNLWSGDTTTSVADGVPGTIRALTRSLKPNDSLMLMVQCVVDWTRVFFVISTENNSFKVLQGDDKHLPDLSRLKAEKYDVDCGNAKYHVEASCNTWMLWSCNVTSDRLLLWDPRTDVFVNLPSFESEPCVPRPTSIALWGFGIGFDPCAPGDYKVVRCRTLEYFRSDSKAYAEVFSRETWNQITYPHDLVWKVYQYPWSLFINGFYYWMAQHSTTKDGAIISFDFAKEEFPPALIPMPSSTILRDITIYCVSLAEYEGHLAAIVFDYHGQDKKRMNIGYPTRQQRKKKNKQNSESFTFEIWEWKHRCWSFVSTYEVTSRVVFMRVIGLYKNDKVFLQDLHGYLWLYDLQTLKLENLDIRDYSLTLTVFPYV